MPVEAAVVIANDGTSIMSDGVGKEDFALLSARNFRSVLSTKSFVARIGCSEP